MVVDEVTDSGVGDGDGVAVADVNGCSGGGDGVVSGAGVAAVVGPGVAAAQSDSAYATSCCATAASQACFPQSLRPNLKLSLAHRHFVSPESQERPLAITLLTQV